VHSVLTRFSAKTHAHARSRPPRFALKAPIAGAVDKPAGIAIVPPR